jgi:hypothetical protein
MRRVLEPIGDGTTPDPAVNFDACVKAHVDRVIEIIGKMPRPERLAYFIEKARDAINWYKKVGLDASNPVVKRTQAWLTRLTT